MPALPTQRRNIDRRNRDVEIVEAAVKVFYEKGYSASSVQDVADEVGVLKGSLYHYISKKEDLLVRILLESHGQAHAIMDEVEGASVSAIERLKLFLQAMYEWYLSNIERVSIYFNQRQYLTGENRSVLRKQAREVETYVRGLLLEAKGEGALRADLDVKLGSFFLLGALNSVPVWYRPRGPFSQALITEQFSEMTINALFSRTD